MRASVIERRLRLSETSAPALSIRRKRRSRGLLSKRPRQIANQIRGDQARLAQLAHRQIAGQAVEMDAELRGLERAKPLPHQRRHQPGQHVAAARRRHAGVAGRILEQPAAVGHQARMSLEHDDDVVVLCDTLGQVAALGLNGRRIDLHQAGELAGMRRDDDRAGVRA